MHMIKVWIAGVLVAAVSAWSTPAFAKGDAYKKSEGTQETQVPQEAQEEAEEDEGILGDLIPSPELRLSGPNALDNIVVEAGAGLQGFSDDLGDQLEGGASWTARAVIGARSLLGAEIAYTGGYYSVEEVDNVDVDFSLDPIDTTGMVVSSSFSGMARLNFLDEKSPVKPFIAGGAGFYRLDSDFDNFNDVGSLELPVAVGVQTFPYGNLAIAARAEWKFLTAGGEDFPEGDQWSTMLTAGANF